MMEIGRRLRTEAAKSLRTIKCAKDALSWFHENPAELSARVLHLQDAVVGVNGLLAEGGPIPQKYTNIAAVQAVAGSGEILTTPTEFTKFYDAWRQDGDYESIGEIVQSLLPTMRDMIDTGRLHIPQMVGADPRKLASHLLMAGYGQLMEDMYGEPGFAGQSVRACQEAILFTQPDSVLLPDILDSMAENKQAFSRTAQALIESALREPKTELEYAAQRINKAFRRGGTAYDVLADIRTFPRPIAVDFNNVIANNRGVLAMNPDAPALLRELRTIGNVFIVTVATGWNEVHEFFQVNGIWSPDMVIMTNKTFGFLGDTDDPHAKELRREFLTMAQEGRRQYKENDLIYPNAHKRVAPIFGKPFPVPLIDDSVAATHDNPGIVGITVQAWESDGYEHDGYTHDAGKHTLTEAAEMVRQHYIK